MTFRESVRWPIRWRGFGHPWSVMLRGSESADPQELLAHQAGAKDKVVSPRATTPPPNEHAVIGHLPPPM